MTVKAMLTTVAGKPSINTEVQVYNFLRTGASRFIGAGRSDASGALNITCSWLPSADYQPRLQLRVRRDSIFIELSENMKTYVNEVADFGTLVVPESATAAPGEASLQQVFEGAGAEIERARSAMRTTGSALKLSNVSVKLRVLPGSTTGRVVLPRLDDIARVGSQALSEVSFDLGGESDRTPGEAPTWPLPSLIGQTEPFARQKLAEGQLRAEVIYQLVNRDEEVGRVRLQRPEAGTAMRAGDMVVLAIGRKG